jgi:hypothetical protein
LIAYFCVLLFGFALWIAYGVARRDLPLVIPNSVALDVTARSRSRSATGVASCLTARLKTHGRTARYHAIERVHRERVRNRSPPLPSEISLRPWFEDERLRRSLKRVRDCLAVEFTASFAVAPVIR